MAKAQYGVQIPSKDALGNPLRIGEAAHHFVTTVSPMRHDLAHLTKGHPHDMLHVHAEDNPENDSHIKQIAAYVGELANAPALYATKAGKSAATWQIRNPLHKPGLPAEALALSR